MSLFLNEIGLKYIEHAEYKRNAVYRKQLLKNNTNMIIDRFVYCLCLLLFDFVMFSEFWLFALEAVSACGDQSILSRANPLTVSVATLSDRRVISPNLTPRGLRHGSTLVYTRPASAMPHSPRPSSPAHQAVCAPPGAP